MAAFVLQLPLSAALQDAGIGASTRYRIGLGVAHRHPHPELVEGRGSSDGSSVTGRGDRKRRAWHRQPPPARTSASMSARSSGVTFGASRTIARNRAPPGAAACRGPPTPGGRPAGRRATGRFRAARRRCRRPARPASAPRDRGRAAACLHAERGGVDQEIGIPREPGRSAGAEV